jgi:ferric-dicitrate binding protein FerR (iron transport regulator)
MMNEDTTEVGATVSPEVAYLAKLTRDELSPDAFQASANAWDSVRDRRERIDRRTERRRGKVRLVFAGACLATMIPLAFLALRAPRGEKPLQVSFTGARLGDHGKITSTANQPNTSLLHFSDGTEVELRPEAAANLVDVTAHGATLALEHGAAQFRVTPLPGARWVVAAGPFRVDVKGTVFDLEWAPKPGTLRLQLHRGSVAVTGPLSTEPILLHDQRELLIDLPRREIKILDQRESAPVPASEPTPEPTINEKAPPQRPAEAPLPATMVREASKDHSRKLAPTWQSLFTAGKLDLILSEAEDAGVDVSLERRSNEDLAALADAARYRGRAGLARRTLLAQRDRFPHSLRAVEAAFLLGRLDESAAGAAPALAWYDRYLGEAPRGRYAAEALGRKMLVVQKLRGTEEARPLAEEYVRRYPEGAYAELARKLTAR